MEIRVYDSMDTYSKNIPLFCHIVECPDTFFFERALSVFRSLYGPKVIVVFLCV